MLLTHFYYIVYILLILFSIFMFVTSIKNKSKEMCTNYTLLCIVCMICLFIYGQIPDMLYMYTILDIILYYFVTYIALFIYFISIIILNVRKRKLTTKKENLKPFKIIISIMSVIIIVLVTLVVYEVNSFKKSDIIIKYYLRDTSAFGMKSYLYNITINEKGCRYTKIGSSQTDKAISEFIQKSYKSKEIDENYYYYPTIEINDVIYKINDEEEINYISITKNDETICKIKKKEIGSLHISYPDIYVINK